MRQGRGPADRSRQRDAWDKAKAKRLYDQDMSMSWIAEECRVARSTLTAYARANWPMRPRDIERQRQHDAQVAAKKPVAKPLKRGQTTLPVLGSLS